MHWFSEERTGLAVEIAFSPDEWTKLTKRSDGHITPSRMVRRANFNAEIVRSTKRERPPASTHWSTRTLAWAVGCQCRAEGGDTGPARFTLQHIRTARNNGDR